MDELNNLGSDVPNTDDLNNVLRSFVDDPNNEVRTYSDSLYIPTENVENVLSQYPNNFSLFSLNNQSLNSKFDSLSAFLSHLNEKDYNFDAICLQETWLPPDGDTSLFNIPGYHLIHQGKICSQHSGLIIYLSNKFSYSVIDIQIRSDLGDGQFVDVYGENLNGKITIGNIYRPPRSNNSNVTLRKFISEIDPVINNIAHENNCSIITGDFNIDLLQINERVEIQKYFDLFLTRGFFPKITLPTRPSRYNTSLIDQLFCKLNNPKQHLISCIIQTQISDHYPYFSLIDILKKKHHRPKFVKINSMNADSLNMFCNDIKDSMKNTTWNNGLFHDPNDNYGTFEKLVVDAKTRHFKAKTVHFNRYKHKISPWVTSGILRSIQFRDKIYRNLQSTSPDTENYNTLKHNLKSYNSILKKTIRQAKADYYPNQFNQSKSSIRHTWSVVKEILNKCKNKREFPNYFVIDGHEIKAHTDISNCFNLFSRVLARTLLTVSILLVIKVSPTTWNKTYTHHLNLLVLKYQKWEIQSMICHRKIAVDMTLYHQSSSNVFQSLLKNHCV